MEASSSTPTMENPNPTPIASEGVEELTLTVKWSGKEYTVRLCADDSVAELKRRICEVTSVLPKRQKLLYPKLASKLNDDSILISQLGLKSSVKMTMIGLALNLFLLMFLFQLLNQINFGVRHLLYSDLLTCYL